MNPIDGSLEAIAHMRRLGHSLLFNPTQGGIAKGIMTPEHVDKVHEHMLDLFGQAGCPSIEGIYYSESSPKK